MKAIARLCLFVFLLQSCATAYEGAKPNLNLRGAEAEAEVKKFTLSEKYFDQGHHFQMGAEGMDYTIESLSPIISEISPEAESTLKTADKWHLVSLGFLGVAVGTLLAGIVSAERSKQRTYEIIGMSASFASILINATIVPILHSDAAAEFNRDLRKKLSAGMAFNWKF